MQFSKTLVIMFLASMAAAAPLASGDMSNPKRNTLATSSMAHNLPGSLISRATNNRPESQLSVEFLRSLSGAQVETLWENLNLALAADTREEVDFAMDDLMDKVFEAMSYVDDGDQMKDSEAEALYANLEKVRPYLSQKQAKFPHLVALFAALDAGKVGA